MMRPSVLLIALGLSIANGMEEIKEASMIETAAKAARASGGSYTISASALKSKVKAEAEKVEKFRAQAASYGMAEMMSSMDSMTEADRLNDMSALIMQKEGEQSGEDMGKSLAPEARNSLVQLQRLFTTSTAKLLEALSTTESINKPASIHNPNRDSKLKEDLRPMQDIMGPLMSHIQVSNDKHPELKPFTKQVSSMMSLFEQKALNELMSSNLPQLQEFKRESFAHYTPEHKAQIEDVCDMIGGTDLLTVLRDPNL